MNTDLLYFTPLHNSSIEPHSNNNFSHYENNLLSRENQLNLRDIFVCNGGDGGLSAGTANTLCIGHKGRKFANGGANAVGGVGGNPRRNWTFVQEIYVGSITVVGLFLLFRVLQKSY